MLLCTAGFDHTIRFWEAPTGVCLEQLPFAESQVNRLVITPDRRFVAAAGNPIIRIFDLAAKAPLRTFEGHSSNVTGIGFQKNGSWMFSSGEDGTVRRIHTEFKI